MRTLKLSKPLLVNGEEISELSYDLDELTAYDMKRVGKLLKSDGDYINVIELDPDYHFCVFCVAVLKQNHSVVISDLDRLSAEDYVCISKIIRSFFTKSLGEESPEASSDT